MIDFQTALQPATSTNGSGISPVQTAVTAVAGFKAGGVACGIRKSGRLDLALIVADQPCTAAGVFTTNLVKAAPVLLDQAHLAANAGAIRALVINSGVANACTGEQGLADSLATAGHVAGLLGCAPEQVLVMSTGVIGLNLPMAKITGGASAAAEVVHLEGWQDAAQAILTTDTRTKQAQVTVETPQGTYTIAGISKGSGMIAPHMATMLGIIATDAAISAPLLQQALGAANDTTFNQIVVDGDMSTNDSVVAFASGASGVEITEDSGFKTFQKALGAVCEALAKDIVRDGEGASRLITLRITGAPSEVAARQVGMTIATSPLVKTAFYGADANWGRILAAAGRAGVAFDADHLALWIAPGEDAHLDEDAGWLQLVGQGAPLNYSEEDAGAIMAYPAVTAWLDLGAGQATSTVWTCDLSHEYVTINGHYRT